MSYANGVHATDRRILLPLVAAAVFGLTAGCKSSDPAREVREYEVRGVIMSLPKTGEQTLSIRHEAIDNFVHRDGKMRGMDAMPMMFYAEQSADLTTLSVNDKVHLNIKVQFQKTPPLRITAIKKLPADTQLDKMRPAKPPGS